MAIKNTKIRNSIVKNIENDTINSGIPAETLSTTNVSSANNIAVILNELQVDKALILTAESVKTLAASGVSAHNVCKMFRKSFSYLNENPHLLEAFHQGRATLGSRIRTTLVDAAIENNNIQSAIYLDKILSGDTVATEVNINVAQSQLSTVSDEELMKVAFTVEDLDVAEGFDTVPYDATVEKGFDKVVKPGGGGSTLGE
jgi:hypothetical protein